jgi:16S rRNA (cytosine967-C5)-methyltransferase
MIAPARTAAYQILLNVSGGRCDLPDAIADARASLSDERDKALAAEIAIGTLRWQGALDHLIAHLARRPLSRLDPEILQILRLSAYQLLHLSRVPASAVVDDAVKMAGRVGKRSASGLVNAVLRTLSRNRSALPLPPPPKDASDRERTLDYLAVTLSHPRWLVERWLDRYGFAATDAWLRFNNSPAALTLRLNPLRTDRAVLHERLEREHVAVSPGHFGRDALIVESGQPLAGNGLDEGFFLVQDEASQLVPLLTGVRPGDSVLDTCASPGGKTTALAAMMRGEGLLVASDVRPRRMALLRRTIEAAGATNVRLVQADLSQPLPFSKQFTRVFVDAPCSGLGTLRRDPDIKWRRVEADLRPLATHELRMLSNAADTVAPGGRLVYATCSSEPEENEAVAAEFLRTHPEFEPLHARLAAPDLDPVLVDPQGHLRTYPHVHSLEAFFAAAFVNKS